MAYPATGSGKVEWLINGSWVDLTASNAATGNTPRLRGTNGIQITNRGRINEQSAISAQLAAYQIEDADGMFNTNNPLSQYYGLIPLGTVCRVWAGTGDNCYTLPFHEDVSSYVSTPDKASLDVVGDIDIRLEIEPFGWRPGEYLWLASKWNDTGNQRSWGLFLQPDGRIIFEWTPDGINPVVLTPAPVIVESTKRIALRVVVDVDAGAANKSVTYYTSTSINGTWTQLGATLTQAGTTSIFSSSADIILGANPYGLSVSSMMMGGKIYAFQMRNSAGTLVVDLDFSTWSTEDTSKADATGNTWTITGLSHITSPRLRYYGELSATPHATNGDVTGRDVVMNVQAAGLIQRLSSSPALHSPMYRNFIPYSMAAYWPCEDPSGSSEASSALSGAPSASTSNVTFGNTDCPPGSDGSMSFSNQSGAFIGSCLSVTDTGNFSFAFWLKLDALPAAQSELFTIGMTGTVRRIVFSVGAISFKTTLYDNGNAEVDHVDVLFSPTPLNQWVGVNLVFSTSGGNVNWSYRSYSLGAVPGAIGPLVYAGTVGRPTYMKLTGASDAAFVGAKFCHIVLAMQEFDFWTIPVIRNASNGFIGELAADRMARLAVEERVNIFIDGRFDETTAMGYQRVANWFSLITDCQLVDQGILYERRDKLLLGYRTRDSIATRRDMDLSYASSHLSEFPADTLDTFGLTNDVTATSLTGSSARAVITSGPYSNLAPPNGVNSRPFAVTANPQSADQLIHLANSVARIGSWPGARYPNVKVELHRAPFAASASLAGQAMALDVGSSVALTSPPAWLAPDAAVLLVQGYSEELRFKAWTITFNTTPAGPYRTGTYDYADIVGTARYDTSASTLNTTITTTGTTVILNYTTANDQWTTTGGSYPLNIMIDGEEITLTTAPAGATSPQTFPGVTRSVNGVVKAHTAGANVTLSQTRYYAY